MTIKGTWIKLEAQIDPQNVNSGVIGVIKKSLKVIALAQFIHQ